MTSDRVEWLDRELRDQWVRACLALPAGSLRRLVQECLEESDDGGDSGWGPGAFRHAAAIARVVLEDKLEAEQRAFARIAAAEAEAGYQAYVAAGLIRSWLDEAP